MSVAPSKRRRNAPSGLRWLLLVVMFFFVLGLSAVGYGICSGEAILSRGHDPLLNAALIPSEGGDAARGKRLVESIVRCGECHAPDLGGQVVVDSGMGRFVAPNITKGGRLTAAYTPRDWLRAIRHGVSPPGRGLWLMPSERFRRIAANDLRDMVAFVRQARSVRRELDPSELSLFGKTLLGFGRLPLIAAEWLAPAPAPEPAPPVGATPSYGKYLVEIAGCADCHGAGLAGGVAGSAPAPRLRGGAAATWSFSQWAALMRDGRTPGGGAVDEALMPVGAYRGMSDVEIGALGAFISAPLE